MSDPYRLDGPEPKSWLVAPRLQPEDLAIPEPGNFTVTGSVEVHYVSPELHEMLSKPIELKAAPGRCEEASMLSHKFYIPCNAPAVSLVEHRGEAVYRMCAPCASHNVRNRGATLIGPYKAEDDN